MATKGFQDEDPGWEGIENDMGPRMPAATVKRLLAEKRQRLRGEAQAQEGGPDPEGLEQQVVPIVNGEESNGAVVPAKKARTTPPRSADLRTIFQPSRTYVLKNIQSISIMY